MLPTMSFQLFHDDKWGTHLFHNDVTLARAVSSICLKLTPLLVTSRYAKEVLFVLNAKTSWLIAMFAPDVFIQTHLVSPNA